MKLAVLALLAAVFLGCGPGEAALPRPAPAPAAVPGDVCTLLRTSPPPVPPPAVPGLGRVRILAFGDFGTGGRAQRAVARAMAEVDRREPFDLGITLGDNFYDNGLNSPTHPRWQTNWEALYDGLGIRIYAVLGNHDYRDPASPKAERARSRLSRSWCFPRPYYTLQAGPVQLFALDTEPIDRGYASVDEQLSWLDSALAASRTPWKVVYGHHPVYTNGEHGERLGYLPALRNRLFPLLKKHRVAIYLAGHDHDLESLKPDQGVHFLISGGGGRGVRPLRTGACRDWAESRFGFTVLEAGKEDLTAIFYGSGGERLHEVRLRKGQAVPDCTR